MAEEATLRQAQKARRTPADNDADRSHTEVQAWIRDLGLALGFRVWIADAPGSESVRLIDVLWLEKSKDHVAAAFEVEHTTSIYRASSGSWISRSAFRARWHEGCIWWRRTIEKSKCVRSWPVRPFGK